LFEFKGCKIGLYRTRSLPKPKTKQLRQCSQMRFIYDSTIIQYTRNTDDRSTEVGTIQRMSTRDIKCFITNVVINKLTVSWGNTCTTTAIPSFTKDNIIRIIP